jgi:pilus assembly protein CpaC
MPVQNQERWLRGKLAWTLVLAMSLLSSAAVLAQPQLPSPASDFTPPALRPGYLNDWQPPSPLPTASTALQGAAGQPAVKPQPFPQMPFPAPMPGATVEGLPGCFGPTCPMPRLPGQPGSIGTAPCPAPATLERYGKYVRGMVDPELTLNLAVGRTRLMSLNTVPKRIQVADETIAPYTLISPKEISLLGKTVGVTVLTIWFTDPKDETKQDVLTYYVRVVPDPEIRKQLEWVYKNLADEINKAFPDSVICLSLVGDKVVVSGHAKDVVEAGQILKLVRAQAYQNQTKNGMSAKDVARIPVERPKAIPGEVGPDGMPPPTTDQYEAAGAPFVINLLRIDGEQQVMLRVTVAEVNRAAARSIGLNFTINSQIGPVFANNTGNINLGGTSGLQNGFGLGGLGFGVGGFNGVNGLATNNFFNGVNTIPGAGIGLGGFNNLPASLDNGQVLLAISALRELQYAKSLAEPNLTALNGQTAHFHAGGEFPVPTVSGYTYAGLQGVSYVPYGVQLSFTPYITERDRIRLVMSAEVSTRDLDNGSVLVGTTAVPTLNIRSFQTTVEICEGQTLAVAGLIQHNLGADSNRVPFFGDLPIIGRLFGFDRVSAGEQELVVLITPVLVHPMGPHEIPPLPGSDLLEPSDLEFYLYSRLESRCGTDFRSPVRTDWGRLIEYFHHTESTYLSGPSGQD